jgi:hypothetical protein
MPAVPPANAGFSPLDAELALLPGSLTPLLQEQLTQLGAWLPFAPAARLFTRFTQVPVSAATTQRLTEAVGLATEALEDAAVTAIAETWPPVPPGPPTALVSVDGAMVPLVGGVWAEVKTLVVGEVEPRPSATEPAPAVTSALSYYSRLASAERFAEGSLLELHRRGLERAERVIAVTDGAEWIQGFLDYHCPKALRILDFPHAASRICQIGDMVLGEGTAASSTWRSKHLHALKQEGPRGVLAEVRRLAAGRLEVAVVAENLAYLEKRVGQMQYPQYQAAGWPIGSGVVESANKLVVEARLKGAGMHWSRASVNPMLALRNAVCNQRWDEVWEQSAERLRQQGRPVRRVTPKRPLEAPTAPEPPTVAVPPSAAAKPPGPRKPAANHPWRRPFSTKAKS